MTKQNVTFKDRMKSYTNKALSFVKRNNQSHFVVAGLLLMVMGRLIFTFGSVSHISFWSEILIYAVVALGLNLLLGFSGLVSLATAAFIGMTTNGIHLLMNGFDSFSLSFIPAAIIALIFTGLMGLLIGVLSLKMEGIYLAIATLFVGHIITEVFRAFSQFNFGETARLGNSIQLLPGVEFSSFFPADRLSLFNILVVFLVLALIIIYNIVHSASGRAFMAISRSQHAALAMGISVRKYRLMAFMIATTFAGLGGIMHALYFQTTGSATKWGLGLSLFILAVVVVGGMKSLWGMLVGSFILFGIPSFFLREIAILSGFEDIMAGLMIVVVILFYPFGAAMIGHDLKKLYHRFKAWRKEREGAHENK